MRLYLGTAVIALALLVAASGTAAVTRGWVLPWNRRHVRRPQPYGWGQLLIALALCCQAVFGLMTPHLGTRQWGTSTGSVLMVTGILVIAASRRTVGHRQRDGAP
ncbi:hypothetical protein ACQPZG_00920 (plasmid) [Streptomyces sp. CA-294286]|uniref:hypothetical protein n=1 Tax=Streptomyces sp. CA-294286 TaxID=3240070 RepID=UPI003D8A6160